MDYNIHRMNKRERNEVQKGKNIKGAKIMKQFKVGGIYTGEDRIEIEVLKRTKQTITFKYTKPNWWEEDTEKEFRKKIRHFNNNYETINLGSHWSEPSVHAN